MSGGGAEREREGERERTPQTDSVLSARSHRRKSWTWSEIKSQMLNRQSQPGTPRSHFLDFFSYVLIFIEMGHFMY